MVLFLLAWWLTSPACGQQEDLNFVNLSSRDGLASNTIYAMLKDRLGYMWFATQDGLNRFDGTRFIAYTHNADDTKTLLANHIMSLCEDAAGNFWAGSSKALLQYDRQKGIFKHYNITGGASARSLCADHQGNLWIGSYSGLFRYTPATGLVRKYVAGSGSNQLQSNTIPCIYEDSRQRLWIGTAGGLHLYQPAQDTFERFCHNAADAASLSDNVVRAIAEDRQGRIWIGTDYGGLNMLVPGTTAFRHFTGSLSSNRVYCIAPDQTGQFWIGTEDGLNIFDPLTFRTVHVNRNEHDPHSLAGKSIRSIFIDPGGLYWIGAYQSGVYKYDRNLTFFNLIQSNPFDVKGLSAPKVTAFCETSEGNVYVGTDGGGLNLFHRRSGTFEHIVLEKGQQQRLAVMTLEQAGNELWVGTYMNGVYVLNTVSGARKHYSTRSSDPGMCLVSNDIFCLRQDAAGNMFIGTNGKGVLVYNAGLKKIQSFSDFAGAAIQHESAMANGFIRAIETDAAGNLWVGILGRGTALYNRAAGTFRFFTSGNTGLPVEDVQSILPDKEGIVWMGTSGNGLCRLDYRLGRFTRFSEEQGLASPVIFKLLRDGEGRIWISTGKGLSCFDPATSRFKNYSASNGLQPSAFCHGAGCRTHTGELYFGGLEGFNYFQPATLHYNRHVPRMVFTDLKIANQAVIPASGGALREQIALAREVHLQYGENFSVDFAALDYTNPSECRYLYKLEGFDKGWNQNGHNVTAVFTNLDPGKYILRVKAYNNNDGWTTGIAALAIYVKPPFWRTGFAYCSYLLLAGFLMWGARYRGIRRLKRRFAAEQEKQRAQLLIEEERKETERQRAFDQARMKFLTNLSHEFRTPVSLIVGPVESLLAAETDRNKASRLSMVKRNARRLMNLVNQLLDFRKLEEQELRLNATEGEIVAFVYEVADAFRDLAERRQVTFSVQSSIEKYFTSFDRDKLERVLFNLLGNAFKFTGRDGRIQLEVKQPGAGFIALCVSDTGIGMSPEEQQQIFEPFFQGQSPAAILNQGSGIGLSIVREFVRLHGGTIALESTPGKGSVFTVTLPLHPLAVTVQQLVFSPVELPSTQPEAPVPATTLAEPDAQQTILVVEDNEDFRVYLRESLQPFYRVLEAADGKEGWQKALAYHPQLLVSDINMPEMDGIALSNKIRGDKRTAHIPLILLTALTDDASQLKGLQTGASDYLTKPFSAEILRVKIRNLLILNHNLKETYSKRVDITAAPPAVQSENEKLLLRITRYIEENLDNEKLSVEELSRQVFMSRGSLYNKIVEITGETPVEFIRSVKLNKAADLLERTDMKIAQVGYMAGFTTPNYFTRAFRAKFNMSPSEYVALKRKPAGGNSPAATGEEGSL